MNPLFAAPDLVPHFEQVLRLCQVGPSETVLIFTDTQFPHYAYPPAALAAARALGATVYVMVAQSDQDVEDRLIHAAWTHADAILGMSFLPGSHSWMYADVHGAALAAGARVLMVQEPADVLKRMLPTDLIRRRGLAGARMMEQASEVHLVSQAGTDLTFRKDGRKGSYQCGIADVPGRWDHWPTGMVYCAPLEDSAQGTLVVQPGDVLLGSNRHASSEMRLCFEDGLITHIDGGPDAQQTEGYFRAAGDEGSRRIAHAGWGTDHRADWRYVGMDSESLYGSVTVGLGRNIFDSPAPHCGLGGRNRSKTHFDICLREVSVYLDGSLILDGGRFIPEELL